MATEYWGCASLIFPRMSWTFRRCRGNPAPVNRPSNNQVLINAEWGESENKRRAKFYTLTLSGRKPFGMKLRAGNPFVHPSAPLSCHANEV